MSAARSLRRPALAAALVVVLVAVLAVVALARSRGEVPLRPAPERAARSAIVFLVDDMSDFSCDKTAKYLPKTSAWLADRGTCFENASTATPVCCPARAQLQTGQLPHNNGVRRQIDAVNINYRNTVQHDLGEAGLTTMGIGKNLNGILTPDYYGPKARNTGFDDFHFWDSYKNTPGSFELFSDEGKEYVPDNGLYSTQTSGLFTMNFLREQLAADQDFYLYDAFFAPHKQNFFGKDGTRGDFPQPTPRNANRAVPAWRYEPEINAEDKLSTFRDPPQSANFFRRLYTTRVQALYDVDDQMAKAIQLLDDAGRLDSTAIIFASDNGYTDRGQVNWDGKSIPYPASTDVPMLAFLPGVFEAGAVETKPVGLIDIAPTLYDLFGVTPDHLLDGHSLRHPTSRTVVYGEYANESNDVVRNESGLGSSTLPSWKMVKSGGVAYVEWYNPDGTIKRQEYYADPGMLRNLLYPGYASEAPSPAQIAEMQRLLYRYADCAGTVEQGSPNPCT